MSIRSATLVAAMLGVAAFALLRDRFLGAPTVEASPAVAAPAASEPAAWADQPLSDIAPSDHVHGAPMGGLPGATDLSAPDEAPAITWTVPPAWKTAPNPSTMRIATYKVAHASADKGDADVSVVRAGGTADANIERWRDQFEGAREETRTVKTVRGFKVTIVEIRGTYLGGAGGTVTSQPRWTLVGAIVETPRLPYFFKLTGASATVRSARVAFDALVESISPS
jgi:hypothetical protein